MPNVLRRRLLVTVGAAALTGVPRPFPVPTDLLDTRLGHSERKATKPITSNDEGISCLIGVHSRFWSMQGRWLRELNTRPRPCLNWATPLELVAQLRHHSPIALEK